MTAALLLALGAGPLAAQQASSVAGGVVSSKEWRVRRAPEKEEEFIGDVRYRGGALRLESDWALFKHKEQLWRARGRVRIEKALDTGETVKAWGDEAVFDQKSGKGRLSGKGPVRFARLPPAGEPDEGSAGLLEWSGQEEARLTGGVEVWGPRLAASGDSALYRRGAQSLRLSGGRPVLVKKGPLEPGESPWTGAVKADEITASKPAGRVVADGAAQGWLLLTKPAGRGRR